MDYEGYEFKKQYVSNTREIAEVLCVLYCAMDVEEMHTAFSTDRIAPCVPPCRWRRTPWQGAR